MMIRASLALLFGLQATVQALTVPPAHKCISKATTCFEKVPPQLKAQALAAAKGTTENFSYTWCNQPGNIKLLKTWRCVPGKGTCLPHSAFSWNGATFKSIASCVPILAQGKLLDRPKLYITRAAASNFSPDIFYKSWKTWWKAHPSRPRPAEMRVIEGRGVSLEKIKALGSAMTAWRQKNPKKSAKMPDFLTSWASSATAASPPVAAAGMKAAVPKAVVPKPAGAKPAGMNALGAKAAGPKVQGVKAVETRTARTNAIHKAGAGR